MHSIISNREVSPKFPLAVKPKHFWHIIGPETVLLESISQHSHPVIRWFIFIFSTLYPSPTLPLLLFPPFGSSILQLSWFIYSFVTHGPGGFPPASPGLWIPFCRPSCLYLTILQVRTLSRGLLTSSFRQLTVLLASPRPLSSTQSYDIFHFL